MRPDPTDVGSFRRQLVVLTAVLGSVVAVALVVVVGIVLERVSGNVVDRVLTDRASAVVAAAGQSEATRTPQVPASLLDPGVAVYDARGVLVAGEAPASLSTTFTRLSLAPARSGTEVGDAFQVLGAALHHVGRRPGRRRGGRAPAALRERRALRRAGLGRRRAR